MNRGTALFIVSAIAVFLAIGCSASRGGPVTPPSDQEPTARADSGAETHALLWGYWDVIFDVQSEKVRVLPNRSAELTLNVVKFLNDDPAGIQIVFNGASPGDGYVDVDLDVTIKHPLHNAGFNGYDVRGVFIGEGSSALAYNADLKYPVHGTDQVLLNADGYSRWFNPSEFWVPKIFGYVHGKHATPGYNGSATLNPYKYFGEGLGATEDLWGYLTSDEPNTGCFLANSGNTRNYQIRLPVPLPGVKYGYVVTANWAGLAPEFHPSHAPEAVGCRVLNNSDVYYLDPADNGGSLILDISLFGWDYQPSTIYIESTVLSSVASFDPGAIVTGGGDHYSTYHVDIPADNVTGYRNQEYWVIAECEAFDYGNSYGVPNDAEDDRLAAMFRYDLDVDYPGGWARTWGGWSEEMAWGMTTSGTGNTYVTGQFKGTVDFDPDGGDPHTSNGYHDAFLSKLDSSGGFEWARTWGGSEAVLGRGVAIDAIGNVYVTGYFAGTADFDPNGGDAHTAKGHKDIYLGKFDSSGDLEWVRTWGSENDDQYAAESGYRVDVDSFGNVYVAGDFTGTADFDPDGGDPHSGGGSFLSKFDPWGDFQWARTWTLSQAWGIAADEFGDVYVSGLFWGTVDFDPDGGDPHTSDDVPDAYLTKFDSSGDHQWARTWGADNGQLGESGFGAAVDGYGYVYVVGRFDSTVDFNPDGGDPHTPNGASDACLSKFDSYGNFQWARTWGGTEWEWCWAVDTDGSGHIYVTGAFLGLADFDPGAGTELHASNGLEDVFLSKFDSSGNFEWVRTWGSPFGFDGYEMGVGVAADGFGNAYVAGQFLATVDFAPTGPPCNEDPDKHTSSGSLDIFLTKHLPDGCW